MRSDDLRALGRVGQHGSGSRRRTRRPVVRRSVGATVATRRPAIPRPVLVGTVAAVAALIWLGAIAAGQTADRLPTADAGAAVAAGNAAAVVEDALPRRPAAADRSVRPAAASGQRFGVVDGLDLSLPHAAPLAVAFHEATRPEALPIDPTGLLEGNDNATKYIAPADGDGPAYRVLASRGRGRPATSAVDIMLPDGARALSPVDGTVVEVRQYALSGGVSDWRVVIQPADRKDLQVVLIHLHQPQVQPGDVVRAGESPLAVVRLLPFASHIDYVVGETHPHVHVEVKPATPAPRFDPNAPAVEASSDADVASRD